MVDPTAAIADVSVGKQACHLISRLAPPRLRARILGCVDHDGVHATWRVGSCVARGRRTDGLSRLVSGRPTGDCGGTPTRAARYVRGAGGPASRARQFRFRSCVPVREGVLCVIYSFHVWRRRWRRTPAIGATVSLQSFDDMGSQIQLCTGKMFGSSCADPRGHAARVCARHRARMRGMCAIGHATRQPSAGGTIPVLPRLPCPSFIIYIAAPPSLRVA